MSILSIVIMALYTSVMSQILLLNTIKVDTFAKAYDQGAEISVTRDVAEQLTLSHRLRWLSMALPYRRREGRARDLPVLVSWPVSSMMKQMSCRIWTWHTGSCPRSVIPHWRHWTM
jgi:hypothetical protein